MSTRIRLKTIASMVATFALAGVAAGSQPSDAWLTAKVKTALLRADSVDGLAINVDILDGMATLHGMVGSDAERTRAEMATLDVSEVRGVRNLIAVVPRSEQQSVSARDVELARKVDEALERDAELGSSQIDIASVNDGIVLLAGRASTLTAHRRAIEVSRDVVGVRKVVSEIHSPDEFGDAEIWEETAAASTRTNSALLANLSDSWITTKAKLKLLASQGLSPMEISVDTRDGVVMLFGIVDTYANKQAAAAALIDVDGVRSVVNGLQVAAEVAAKSAQGSDDRVLDAIQKRLRTSQGSGLREIDVEVNDGVVRLTGNVSSQQERRTVLSLARGAEGVRYVIDGLTVETRS